jgi:myosin heavy subunit
MKEIILKMIEILKKSGINFRSYFEKDLESINVNLLLKLDKNEIKKFVNLIILFLFNCAEKDIFIDKIATFEDFSQQELLKIIERYMSIDEPTESIKSRNISNRNTITGQYSDSMKESVNNLIESEFTSKFLSRIEYLEKERDNAEKEKIKLQGKVNQLDSDIETLHKEKSELNLKLKSMDVKLISSNKENEELKKNSSHLLLQIRQLEEMTKETKIIPEYMMKLKEKDSEIHYMNEYQRRNEESHQNEIKSLNDKIELLQENLSSAGDMKKQYDKMRDMIKDSEALKDKIKFYEGMNKEFVKIKSNYENLKVEKETLEALVKELEEKLDQNIQNYNKIREQDDNYFAPEVGVKNNLNSDNELIKKLTLELNELKSQSLHNQKQKLTHIDERSSKTDDYEKIIKLKQDTIATQNETISSMSEKINHLQTEYDHMKNILELESLKRIEEIEFYKKDNNETKDRYEKEFELMASAVYNLGLNFWSMKMEYTQKLNEKPNWLVKERQKYFNGDF